MMGKKDYRDTVRLCHQFSRERQIENELSPESIPMNDVAMQRLHIHPSLLPLPLPPATSNAIYSLIYTHTQPNTHTNMKWRKESNKSYRNSNNMNKLLETLPHFQMDCTKSCVENHKKESFQYECAATFSLSFTSKNRYSVNFFPKNLSLSYYECLC